MSRRRRKRRRPPDGPPRRPAPGQRIAPRRTEDEALLQRPTRPEFLDIRPVAFAAHPVRVRRGLRRARGGRAGGQRLRVGPDQAEPPRLPPGARARLDAGQGGLRGHHRRRARDHGGGQPGLPGGRRPVGRLQHRAAQGAGAQPVRRSRRRVPLLLRPQGDVREVRRRLRHLPGRLRDARRAVRGAHADPDQEGPRLPGHPDRPRVLERA